MFRFYSKDPNTSVRVTVVGEHSEGVLKIAVSRCSEQDNFSKAKGRMMTEGRLAKGKVYFTENRETCTTADFLEKAKEIAATVAATKWYNKKD